MQMSSSHRLVFLRRPARRCSVLRMSCDILASAHLAHQVNELHERACEGMPASFDHGSLDLGKQAMKND